MARSSRKPAPPDPADRNVIQLSGGELAQIDEEDFDRVGRYHWRIIGRGGPGTSVGNQTVYLRRFILGAQRGELVVNLNHDLLDNRKTNLRRCTRSEANARVRRSRDAYSRYKGVGFKWKGGQKGPPRRKWCAQIRTAGKQRFLGYFDREEDAARAYDVAAQAMWGEFARLNFPLGVRTCA